MSYSIELDEKPTEALRRVAGEQLSRALDSLDDVDEDPVEAVHDVRKRCKKVRGLLRLVRGSFDDYGDENATLRDAARLLSDAREAHVAPLTYTATVQWAAGRGLEVASPVLELSLQTDADRATEVILADAHRRSRVADALEAAADRAEDWELDDDGVDAFAKGLHKTYRRGHEAMQRCREGVSVRRLHEWRKRAKYTRYHLRLLAPAAPEVLAATEDRFHDLTDLLGDDHDLADLAERMQVPIDDGAAPLRVALDGRRAELTRRAFEVGRVLHAEDPDDFADRILAYRAGATDLETPLPGRPGALTGGAVPGPNYI